MKPVSLLKGWLFLFLWCVILGGCGIPTTSMQGSASMPTSRPEPSPGAFMTCRTRQPLLVAGQMTSNLGNAGVQLSFQNQSRVSCTLSGYPTLQLLDAQQKPVQAKILPSTAGYLYSTRPPDDLPSPRRTESLLRRGVLARHLTSRCRFARDDDPTT